MVIQECSDPFLSSNTDKGDPWFSTIDEALKTAKVGLVFITAENQNEPWLNFESGALITRLGDRRLCPVLVGLSKSDYAGPMKNLQLTDLSDKDDMMALLTTINSECDRPLGESVLRATFDREWPDLDAAVIKAREEDTSGMTTPPRGLDEKVDEVLEIVRTLGSRSKSEPVPAATSSSSHEAAKRFIQEVSKRDRDRQASWVAALRLLSGRNNKEARLEWLREEFGGDYATANYDETKQGLVTDVRLSKQGVVVVGVAQAESDELMWISLRRVDITPF